LMHRIRKDQFNLVKLSLKDTAAPLCGMPSCWLDKISLVMRNT
jgi:hypothetical protein